MPRWGERGSTTAFTLLPRLTTVSPWTHQAADEDDEAPSPEIDPVEEIIKWRKRVPREVRIACAVALLQEADGFPEPR
jgi:hypothetical protein